MQSFGNLGPGNMLGLTSTESYATAVRGTLCANFVEVTRVQNLFTDTLYSDGFSAAIGKVGAVVGTQSFTPIRNNLGPQYTFIVYAERVHSRLTRFLIRFLISAACCGLVGMIVTFFFIRNECVLPAGPHACAYSPDLPTALVVISSSRTASSRLSSQIGRAHV